MKTTKNENDLTNREMIITILNNVFIGFYALMIFILTSEAIKTCNIQCSSDNCKYAIEGVIKVAFYCCCVLAVFIFCNCHKQQKSINNAVKFANVTGKVMGTLKKGFTSDSEEDKK